MSQEYLPVKMPPDVGRQSFCLSFAAMHFFAVRAYAQRNLSFSPPGNRRSRKDSKVSDEVKTFLLLSSENVLKASSIFDSLWMQASTHNSFLTAVKNCIKLHVARFGTTLVRLHPRFSAVYKNKIQSDGSPSVGNM